MLPRFQCHFLFVVHHTGRNPHHPRHECLVCVGSPHRLHHHRNPDPPTKLGHFWSLHSIWTLHRDALQLRTIARRRGVLWTTILHDGLVRLAAALSLQRDRNLHRFRTPPMEPSPRIDTN